MTTMAVTHVVVGVVLVLSLLVVTMTASEPMIRMKVPSDSDYSFCSSWKFVVETNDVAPWTQVPERCVSFVEDYVTGPGYRSDSEAVSDQALLYAASLAPLAGDGLDAWVFDIDETLLSNIPWYSTNGYGSQIFDGESFNRWVDLAEAPPLPASLRLYKALQDLGFTIILLTGRDEFQRNCTHEGLLNAGFTNWETLFLRGDADQGKLATIYKSEKRRELIDQGFRIHGNSGDQWSDLFGFAVATRSFKLPNPLYYIA